jgi:hypothetical protein
MHVLVAALGALALAAPANAASTKQVLYYLQMHTGAQAERFSVRLTPPRFATQGPFAEGQSIDGPRAIALQGAGNLGAVVQEPRILPPCSPRDARFHGYATGATTVDVALPPNTGTTLAVRYLTGHRAPWIDGDYRLTFGVRSALVGTYEPDSPFSGGATAVKPTTIRTGGPTPGGRLGAHLLLSTTPRGTTKAGATAKRVGARTRIAIAGRLLPAKRNRAIVVEWSHPGGRLHTLARARTGAGGRFSVGAWRPPAAGTYELWARYPTQPGGLAADTTSCPVLFRRG